jgi:TonB family protein
MYQIPVVRSPVPSFHCAFLRARYPTHSMPSLRNAICRLLTAAMMACGCSVSVFASTVSESVANESELSFAVCPIVYPLDQAASDRGLHYLFYGNGFFINDKGYLLTAAHVLSQLGDAPPYVLLRLSMAPPRLVKATVIATDRDHDVALLRVTPNPFEARYQVRFLPLAVDWPVAPQSVLAAALRPSRLRDPHTFDVLTEDRPAGQVLAYQFSQLYKGRPNTELLLFGHEVLLGDSGGPVVSPNSQGVVGMIEGRWVRADAAALLTAADPSAGGVGAAVPIHYAISLLQQQDVAWHAAREATRSVAAADESNVPSALSLVPAPYPSQALQSGEVLLDARVDRNGQLADIKVTRGATPFVDEVLNAVHTWSFVPAGANEERKQTRIGIVFQFASPGLLAGRTPERHADMGLDDASDHASLPVVTTEPAYFTTSTTGRAIILSAHIDTRGKPETIDVLDGAESAASAVELMVRQWQFAPGKCAGSECRSNVIIVVIPRQGATPVRAQSVGRLQAPTEPAPQ